MAVAGPRRGQWVEVKPGAQTWGPKSPGTYPPGLALSALCPWPGPASAVVRPRHVAWQQILELLNKRTIITDEVIN